MKNNFELILQRKSEGKKSLAVLIDPDKTQNLSTLLSYSKKSPPHFFFVGGSKIAIDNLDDCIREIREASTVPIILFPGSPSHISSQADSILLLSLISGRNPDLLIGYHVDAADSLRESLLEIIPTGYILIESGEPTMVNLVSKTEAILREDIPMATKTALAGEQLGLKLIYLEAGSGAKLPVPVEMIQSVRKNLSVPLLVGGGIKTKAEIIERCKSGADVIVIGNILEKTPELLVEFDQAIHSIY